MAEVVEIAELLRIRRNRPRRRLWQRLWAPFAAFVFVALGGAVILAAVWTPVSAVTVEPDGFSASFAHCAGKGEETCIVDGDTFRLEGETIRIADIDTPEVHGFECAAEKALGDRATLRLAELLNAGPFALRPAERDEDVYGRKLRVVSRAGQSLGAILVTEGLAHRWDGARHPWC